jgi:hypothetical protein
MIGSPSLTVNAALKPRVDGNTAAAMTRARLRTMQRKSTISTRRAPVCGTGSATTEGGTGHPLDRSRAEWMSTRNGTFGRSAVRRPFPHRVRHSIADRIGLAFGASVPGGNRASSAPKGRRGRADRAAMPMGLMDGLEPSALYSPPSGGMRRGRLAGIDECRETNPWRCLDSPGCHRLQQSQYSQDAVRLGTPLGQQQQPD